MRSLRLFAVVTAFAAALGAQSFTGRWEARVSQNDEARKSVLALSQSGNTLTGYLQMQQNNQPAAIVEGAVNGNQITFIIERQSFGGRAPAPAPAAGAAGRAAAAAPPAPAAPPVGAPAGPGRGAPTITRTTYTAVF